MKRDLEWLRGILWDQFEIVAARGVLPKPCAAAMLKASAAGLIHF